MEPDIDLQDEIDKYLAGPCTKEAKEKCSSRSGPHLERFCNKCTRKGYEPHPYVAALYRIYMLQEAGFPVDADIMDLDEWMDLAQLRQKIAAKMYNPIDPDHRKRPENQRPGGRRGRR